jgi:hypothetical protein
MDRTLEHFHRSLSWCRDNWPDHVRMRDCQMPDNDRWFLVEYAIVVYNSGFRAAVVQRHWDRLTEAWRGWHPLAIAEHLDDCVARARMIINNRGKVQAIASVATLLDRLGWIAFRDAYCQNLDSLRQLPWIGPITCYHLARNIGMDYAKPDVHLSRIARDLDWGDDVQGMCRHIATHTGESVGFVDSVLWAAAARYTESEPRTEAGI